MVAESLREGTQKTMANSDKFTLLRKLLKALGLKDQAVDEIVDRIVDLLSGGEEAEAKAIAYPYHLRDDFLSIYGRECTTHLRPYCTIS